MAGEFGSGGGTADNSPFLRAVTGDIKDSSGSYVVIEAASRSPEATHWRTPS